MQKTNSKDTKSSFGVQDVLFIVFKHKWMILVLTVAGLVAAAAVFLFQKPIYKSKAKLLVRYVMETTSVDSADTMRRPGAFMGRGGDPVILTEIEILKSLDLARDVASDLGVERLLPGAAGSENMVLSAAAGMILSELEVGQGESPNVLHLTYGNEQRELVKEVLEKVVEHYFKRHLEIHRSAAAFDLVAKQTEEVRQRLAQTERELNDLRTKSGILSLEDATASLSAQKARTLDDLMKAKAELAEQQASLNSWEQVGETGNSSRESGRPNSGAQAVAQVDQMPVGEIPPAAITEYRAAMELLSLLRKRDLELRIKFKTGNRLLVQNQQQIDAYEARRLNLLKQYPALSEEKVVVSSSPAGASAGVRTLDAEKARLAAITAKIRVFEAHLEEIGKQFSEQYAIGARIEEMSRRKEMEDAEYRSLEAKLKEAKLDQTLDPSRMPNITVVQEPSEPLKSFDELTMKIVLGLAAGGLALGLGLAFLIELLFNRKVERPIEIQARLQLPLLLSIPFVRKNQRGGLLLGRGEARPRIESSDGKWEPLDGGNELAVSGPVEKPAHFIMPFSQTIRDRIIFNFEVNNVIHKPKLIAVTAMSEAAGTSTIAAGLAKSFSEIRNAKVLLVDLSSFRPDDNPVFGEIPRHSLPNALRLAQDSDFRERPQNLYYANASTRRDGAGLSQFTPLHLHEMMPLLHASEYDYIIFDMPAITQTSPTLTMAGLMDKVLLVLDAENTSREGLKWGYSELTRGRADVSCIFNKTRTHGPDWLIGAH